MKTILRSLGQAKDMCPNSLRLFYGGNRVSDNQTVGGLGMEDEDEFYLGIEQRGGKPVIYLFPPQPQQDIHVHLSLVDSWTFSALYPPTPLKTGPTANPRLGQSVSWAVDASPGGTLLDKGTNREVSYLFWEAQYVL